MLDVNKLKSLNILVSNASINGDGLIEENTEVYGGVRGRFYIGSYTKISHGSTVINAFIGRFTTISSGAIIGELRPRFDNFSNHSFAYGESFKASDKYLNLLQGRYYYERASYTFIGNDVFIGRNAVIYENVSVGDGVFIYPNSVVEDDVPDYAIVSGNPAKIIGYRFNNEDCSKLKSIKWWNKDLSQIVKKQNPGRLNLMNYTDNSAFIDELFKDNSDPVSAKLIKKLYYINTYLDLIEENFAVNLITGPSHVDLWFKKYCQGQLKKPKHYHLFPLPAVSLFSNNLEKLVSWWVNSTIGGGVLLFVPDFRIGNAAVQDFIKRGRFIDSTKVNEDVSKKCYSLGLEQLRRFSKMSKVKFWFWCLYGREVLNRKGGKYIDKKGNYAHPIWNYQNLINEFNSTIDVSRYFSSGEEFLKYITDSSIHPTHQCYEKLINIFDSNLFLEDHFPYSN